MANIKSQIKRNRTNEAARLRNKAVKSAMRTSQRHFAQALAAGDLEQAETLLRQTTRRIDKAASKGVLHKNTAANYKSSLVRNYNQAVKAQAA